MGQEYFGAPLSLLGQAEELCAPEPGCTRSSTTASGSSPARGRVGEALQPPWQRPNGRPWPGCARAPASSTEAVACDDSGIAQFNRSLSQLRRDGFHVRLATETFVSRATSSNGSPRNNRATTANLRLTEKRFGPFPSTPEGAPAPALGERSGAARAARHHSSCLTLRLRFNLPQPGVSIIRAAPQ